MDESILHCLVALIWEGKRGRGGAVGSKISEAGMDEKPSSKSLKCHALMETQEQEISYAKCVSLQKV